MPGKFILVNPNTQPNAIMLATMTWRNDRLNTTGETQFLTDGIWTARKFDTAKAAEDYLRTSTETQRSLAPNPNVLSLRDLEFMLVAEVKATFEVLERY